MSNYTKTTDFGAKDSLPTGDSGKIIRGTEFETEFDAISTAIATKADIAGPTFTGTLTYETISDGTISITAFVDEDDMSSNSANLVPTQQSVKAYVDAVTTELQAQDLDFQADTGGALSIDLDSETMTFTGGTGIDTSGLGNAVTFAIDSTVATLTGTQTLTNKTLTSPDVNTPDIDGGTIDGTVIGGTTPAAVSATTVSATGNITVGGTVDGRDVATDGTKLDGIEAGATADQTAAEIRTLVEAATDSNVFTDADHSKLNGIEASADVTDTTNVTAAGALMDSELTSEASVKALNQGVATTDSPTFAAVTVNGNVEFDGLSGTGAVTVTDILDQDDMSGNSATALATQQSIKAYVDSQVDTVDTLSEVLANGNTTGGTDVAVGTGDDITFADSSKAIFGAGSDLQIYHDGNNSRIQETGTGSLLLRGTNLKLQDSDGYDYVACEDGGGEGGTIKIKHNNSTVLTTTSTGIDVTGSISADGLNVDSGGFTINTAGASLITSTGSVKIDIDSDNNATDNRFLVTSDGNTNNRLQVGENGDISFYEDTGTTAKLFWDASAESLGVGTTSPNTALHLSGLTGSPPKLTLEEGGAESRIYATKNSPTNSDLRFQTEISGTIEDRMVINYSGNVGIGTNPSKTLDIEGNIRAKNTAGSSGAEIDITSGGTWRFRSNATTGTNSYGLDIVKGSAGTDVKMSINSSGNVGIGTSSPAGALHIHGGSYGEQFISSSNSAMRFVSTGGVNYIQSGTATSSSSAADLIFTNVGGSGETMRITSAGLVGIGVTPSASHYKCLEIGNAGSNITGRGAADTHFMSGLFWDGQSTHEYAVSSVAVGKYQITNGIHYWATAPAGTAGNTATPQTNMMLDVSGNLLVGKTSENTTTVGIQARADGLFSAVKASAESAIFGRNTDDGNIVLFRKDGTTKGAIGTDATQPDGTEYAGANLYIGAGDAGLGFTDDGDLIYPYDVDSNTPRDGTITLGHSSARFKDFYLSGKINPSAETTFINAYSATVANGAFVYVGSGGSITVGVPTAASRTPMSFRNTNGEVGTISTQGSSTAYNTSSDYRLKENVVAMSGATERLKQLAPKRFNFIADADVTVDGFLAHEVADVVPEAITGAKDAVDDDGNAVYQGIDQSKLVPLLVATIQELEARIAALESN